MGKDKIGYLYIMPMIILVVVIMAYPAIQNFVMSFTKWDGMHEAEFIGIKNFIKIFNDLRFYNAIKNNFKIAMATPLFVFIPLVLAVLIFNGIKGWKIVQSTIFIPYVVAMTIAGSIFNKILAIDGTLNTFLEKIGLEFFIINWLSNPETALIAIIITWFWGSFGIYTVIYLAGLSTIPLDIYDASKVDGANFFQTLFYITIPYLKKNIFIISIMAIIAAFRYMFDYVYIMTEGGPGYGTFTIEYLIYHEAFNKFNMGYACAVAMILFFVIIGFSFFQIKLIISRDNII